MNSTNKSFPKVSILIAARNEEENILACLQSIRDQDYPGDTIEVLVGNDMSEDRTGKIVSEFSLINPNFHLIDIVENIKHLRGKANVLAQLIAKSKSEFLLVTDADVIVSKSWVRGIMENFTDDISMLSGATIVEVNSLMASLQNAEWIFYVGNGHIYSRKGKPVSAIGSNMAFRKSSYNAIGGYENIPFSVTEDYELFKNILKSGGKFKTVFEPDVLIYTKPITNFLVLLHQRRRWLTAVFRLPTEMAFGLLFLWILLPIIILVGFLFGWKWALGLFILKWSTDLIFMRRLYKSLDQKLDLGFWLYTPYSLIFNTMILIFYLIPAPVLWKGRKYKK